MLLTSLLIELPMGDAQLQPRPEQPTGLPRLNGLSWHIVHSTCESPSITRRVMVSCPWAK